MIHLTNNYLVFNYLLESLICFNMVSIIFTISLINTLMHFNFSIIYSLKYFINKLHKKKNLIFKNLFTKFSPAES